VIECGARQQEVVEAAATVVQEHQIIKHTSSCRGGRASAWFLVASLVDVVGLAKGVEIRAIAIKVRAVVRHILLQVWHLWVRVANVCSDASRILVAVGQASFLCLRALEIDMVISG